MAVTTDVGTVTVIVTAETGRTPTSAKSPSQHDTSWRCVMAVLLLGLTFLSGCSTLLPTAVWTAGSGLGTGFVGAP